MKLVMKPLPILWLFTMIAIFSETNISMAQVEWQKNLDGPIVNLGGNGEWDSDHIFDPVVLFDGAEYKMWYSGVGDHDPSNARIGYATSMDGAVWEKHPARQTSHNLGRCETRIGYPEIARNSLYQSLYLLPSTTSSPIQPEPSRTGKINYFRSAAAITVVFWQLFAI